LAFTNTLAFYITELIMAVKSFVIQATGLRMLRKQPTSSRKSDGLTK